jgi:hypothetical protein
MDAATSIYKRFLGCMEDNSKDGMGVLKALLHAAIVRPPPLVFAFLFLVLSSAARHISMYQQGSHSRHFSDVSISGKDHKLHYT